MTEQWFPTISTIMIRTRRQAESFFDGLELLEPGVVRPQHWRPGPDEAGIHTDVPAYCGVARKN